MLETYILDQTFGSLDNALSYYISILKQCSTNEVIKHTVLTSKKPFPHEKFINQTQWILNFDSFEVAKFFIEKNWGNDFIAQHAHVIRPQDPILQIKNQSGKLIYPIDDGLDQLRKYLFAWEEPISKFLHLKPKAFQKKISKWIDFIDLNAPTPYSISECEFSISSTKMGRHQIVKDLSLLSSHPNIFDVWAKMNQKLYCSTFTTIITNLSPTIVGDEGQVLVRNNLQQVPYDLLTNSLSEHWLDIDCMSEGKLKAYDQVEYVLIMRKGHDQEYELRLILASEKSDQPLEKIYEAIMPNL